jgi:hypothetical protein
MPCDAETASILFRQHVYSLHFSESDFTVADRRRLNRLAVPNLVTVASHFTQHHISSYDYLSSGSINHF